MRLAGRSTQRAQAAGTVCISTSGKLISLIVRAGPDHYISVVGAVLGIGQVVPAYTTQILQGPVSPAKGFLDPGPIYSGPNDGAAERTHCLALTIPSPT